MLTCKPSPLDEVLIAPRRCESAIGFEGAFESDTHVYLAMELVDGGDLSDVLQVDVDKTVLVPSPAFCTRAASPPHVLLLGRRTTLHSRCSGRTWLV